MRRLVISQFRSGPPVRVSLLLLVIGMLMSSAFGQTFTSLYSFGAVPGDGVAPGSGVVVDKNGNLFGTTGVGGIQGSNGTVFELTPPATVGNPWTETILHRFRGTPDGKISESRLIMTAKGALLGTTLRGGSVDMGTVYMLAPPSAPGPWKEKIIHDFGTVPDDVVSPNLGLLGAPEGYYGADQGGANNFGAVYLLTPPASGGTTWTQNILYSFKGSGDAADPLGELVRDSAGNFYGVTALGGANNLGAVYEVSPPAVQGGPWTEKVLYSFNLTDGTLPAGRLLLGANGVLYGTTNGGGANGAGTVFQLTPPTVSGGAWTETILYTFTGGLDGSSPSNGVIADKKGRLFGSAGETIFMLTPPQVTGGAWTETVLHDFTGPDGFVASTPLILSKGFLYGTTQQGGSFGTGTVFQISFRKAILWTVPACGQGFATAGTSKLSNIRGSTFNGIDTRTCNHKSFEGSS